MRKSIGIIIKCLFSGILLYLILQKLGVSQLVSRLCEGKLEYLLFGVILGLVCNLIKLYKWSYLVNSAIKCSFWDGFQSYTIGFSFGLITPLRAGELGRALYFDKEQYPRIAGMTLFDRALDVNAVLLLSVPGSFILFGAKFGTLISLFTIALTFSLYKSSFIMRIIKRNIPVKFNKAKIIELISSIEHLGILDMSIYLTLSLLAFSLSIIELYFLISAFERVFIEAVVLSIPLMSLSNVLPISFMGIGVREGVAYYLLSKFSVSGYASVSAAFLSFIINNLLLGIIGTFFIPRLNFSK